MIVVPFLSQITVIGLISFLGRLIANVLVMAIYQSSRRLSLAKVKGNPYRNGSTLVSRV